MTDVRISLIGDTRFTFANTVIESIIGALSDAREDNEFAYIVGEDKAIWINPKNVVAVWAIPEFGNGDTI